MNTEPIPSVDTIPLVRAVGRKLGFNKGQDLNGLLQSARKWRKELKILHESEVADIQEWKTHRAQKCLTDITLRYLEDAGYGEVWWPRSNVNKTRRGLQYHEDKDRYVETSITLIWT